MPTPTLYRTVVHRADAILLKHGACSHASVNWRDGSRFRGDDKKLRGYAVTGFATARLRARQMKKAPISTSGRLSTMPMVMGPTR
jgi:hypothetical protein